MVTLLSDPTEAIEIHPSSPVIGAESAIRDYFPAVRSSHRASIAGDKPV